MAWETEYDENNDPVEVWVDDWGPADPVYNDAKFNTPDNLGYNNIGYNDGEFKYTPYDPTKFDTVGNILDTGTAGSQAITGIVPVSDIGQGAPLEMPGIVDSTGAMGSGMGGGATDFTGALIGTGTAADGQAFINGTDPVYNDAKFNVPGNLGTNGNSGAGSGSTSGLMDVAKSLGLTNKDGELDWSKLIGLGAAGAVLANSLNAPAYNPKTPGQLLAMQPSNTPGAFTQAQMVAMQVPLKAGNQLTRQYAADMPSPIQPGKKYAEGGNVAGPLSATFDSTQGPGMVIGPGGGQDDQVDASLSPGEYVFDAESVAMLGDGDNAAGARKLDELRQQLRAHKRSAPNDEIAPKSTGPLSYMGAQ